MGVVVMVVVVTAMLVMLMIMAMAMAMIIAVMMVVMIMMVIMAVIMRMAVDMIAPGMAMRLYLGVRMLRIGAAFGIERRFDFDDAGAEPLHHRLDHMIPADAQALRHDLRRQMTVAEMPGDPDQMMRIAAADLDERLRSGDHLDQAAVLQHQRIAATQRCGVLEIEQEFESARPGHRHPPPVPIVEIEHDGVGRCVLPAVKSQNLGRADH
ncbi:hypothetical protein AS156_01985 [Bradyrhizobium macuxiense]|uniref:Uncharacterized protein n=1 Tax=Bradyrhizobium macuxiense TaxID=1755647 RepID=A0A109J9F6_9BRAD|nr:hypothetical protein AS156_01985 [Bradyrhizobium macuxiense]